MVDFAYFAAASALGACAGLGFAVIWLAIVPMRVHGALLSSLSAFSMELARIDEISSLMQFYKRLIATVAGYTVRNLLGVLAATLPAVLIVLTVGAGLFNSWTADARSLVVVPMHAGNISRSAEEQGNAVLTLNGTATKIQLEQTVPRAAVCWNVLRCSIFELLEFQVTALDAPPDPKLSSVVVRADQGRRNPVWPYLDDLEFTFFVAFLVTMTAGMIVRVREARREEAS